MIREVKENPFKIPESVLIPGFYPKAMCVCVCVLYVFMYIRPDRVR